MQCESSNTHEAIFDALKKRRCYGFTGGRVYLDFRINGHYMGEEFAHRGVREIYYSIKADAKIKRVTVVKNCRDYMLLRRAEQFFYDYKAEVAKAKKTKVEKGRFAGIGKLLSKGD